MKKVKVWWPTGKNGVLRVKDLEDLMRRLKGFSYTLDDQNPPKGFDWAVKDMTKDRNSCNC